MRQEGLDASEIIVLAAVITGILLLAYCVRTPGKVDLDPFKIFTQQTENK